jgi:pyridoxal phosphate enzyme (YggS family)
VSVIAERYEAVRQEVCDAADAVGRDASGITMVAISKTVGVQEIRQAIAAGMRDFGENRAHEFVSKQALFPDVDWHMVGTLQSNKVRQIVGKAKLVHSVDRIKILDTIDRHARELHTRQDVLLEVNVSGESTKHGFHPGEVEGVLARSADLRGVAVKGLMTMAPMGPPKLARPVFRELAGLFARLAGMRFNGVEMTELSMGMSNDYRVAVEEGATIVRVGRSIFGNGRQPHR